jgi:hypothetical protein
MNEERLDQMMRRLPERDRWRLLQDAIDRRLDWPDAAVRRLDARMQGLLFLQDHVRNREARIAFARSPDNMLYLREAAGSRNVWMSDAEFDELVEENDPETLACFARCEAMAAHHLIYIGHLLAARPHLKPGLGTTHDASITARKVLEVKGVSREVALMRLARAALGGAGGVSPQLQRRVFSAIVHAAGDPRALWRAYLNLATVDDANLRGLLEAALGSSDGPVWTSRSEAGSVH